MYDIILGRSAGDVKKLGKKGAVLIGKQYVQMGQTSSLSNPIYMDVSRAHAMLICGKRGCLTEDTMVYTDKGNKKIIDFNEKKDKILSFNKESQEFIWEKAKFLSYDISKKEELYSFELQDGQLIKATAEHPLCVYRSGKLYWIIASEITSKDCIVSVSNIPKIPKFRNKESLRIARLLGFLLADGTLNVRKGRYKDGKGYWYNGTKKRLRIINSEEAILKQAKNDLDKEFNINSRIYKKGDENCYVVENEQQRVVNKFIKLGVKVGKKDSLIEIPEIVWKSSLTFKKEFIKALFSCDGYVDKVGRVCYYSNSIKIMKDLNLLLLEFGIHSRIRNKVTKCNGKFFNSYELNFSDYLSIIRFQKIGFFNKVKNERLNARKFNKVERRKSTIYLDDNTFCQKIKNIEKINGVKKVYDLRVPRNHSFIANGIISHNSGKSYTLGSIAEGLADLDPEISKNLSFILLDTMGVYWSMKYPNEKDDSILKKWNLEGKPLNVVTYVPGGFFDSMREDGIPVDFPFYLEPKELTVEDWLNAFTLQRDDPLSVALEKIVGEFLEKKIDFGIDDLIEGIEGMSRIEEHTKQALSARLENAKRWGIFSKKGTPITDLLIPGTVTVFDLSPFVAMPGGWEIKALVLGLVAKKIFVERMLVRKREELADIANKTQVTKVQEVKEDLPMPWLIVDECLTYDSLVQTDCGLVKIGKIVENFKIYKKSKVIGYDKKKETFSFFPITKVYDQGKRDIIEIRTESGTLLKCTPDHKLFSKNEFEEAKKAKWLSIPLEVPYSQEKKEVIARLIGHIYGDGWLSYNGQVGFSSDSDNRNLFSIKEDLKRIGFTSSNIFSRTTESKVKSSTKKVVTVKGESNSIHASTKAHQFFKKLNVVEGKKTEQKTMVPQCIMKGSLSEKAEFLAGLFGADANIMSQSKVNGSDFNPVRLTYYRNKNLEKSGENYGKQLIKLFLDLGIKVSKLNVRKGNIRLDGSESVRFELSIAKNVDNMIVFLEKVGYRYSKRKERIARAWLSYFKARKECVNERKSLRNKVLKRRKDTGFGTIKLAREFGIEEYVVRDWLYGKSQVGVPKSFPSFKQWFSKRDMDSRLLEKIVSKESKGVERVYDISVDKVHNFIANGVLVHNCHEFLPRDKEVASTHALMTILREGRQPGVSLIMATQQPGKIHTDAITQSDIVLSHRITASFDLDALDKIFLSYDSKGSKALFNSMPRVKGCAIIMDDKNERLHTMQVKPRITWHGGEDPNAIREIEDDFDF